jgi:hypothetical protein
MYFVFSPDVSIGFVGVKSNAEPTTVGITAVAIALAVTTGVTPVALTPAFSESAASLNVPAD